MRLEDIAKWHRIQEQVCRQSEQIAATSYERGCEDATFAARGWHDMADRHARMAETIEDSLEKPSSIPVLDLSDQPKS